MGILTFAPGVSPNGVAVPSSAVHDVEDQLDNSGKVSHGWMGVWCSKDDADLPQGGATVVWVLPGSPADKAGLDGRGGWSEMDHGQTPHPCAGPGKPTSPSALRS